jgi:Lipocalin-like domain
MSRRIILGISAVTTLGLVFLSGLAVAQTKSLKEQLVGTWLVAAVDNIRPDGSRFQSLGPSPKGIMMFDATGWFSFQLAQPGRPKFASDNRLQGTAEENKATVQGSLSYYGKYSVDEADRVLHLYIESSSYPNFDGIDNKRIITSLSEDELKWYSPAGSIGTTAEVVWKRPK